MGPDNCIGFYIDQYVDILLEDQQVEGIVVEVDFFKDTVSVETMPGVIFKIRTAYIKAWCERDAPATSSIYESKKEDEVIYA